MISSLFKIFSVIILLIGLLAIMIIKNISAEKQNYINELEITLREEQNKSKLLKIEWDHMISPINLKKISEMVISNDYTKYFVVLDKDDLDEEYQVIEDIITVDMPSRKIVSPAR